MISQLFLFMAIACNGLNATDSDYDKKEVIPLMSGSYYFIGNDTGWAQKTQASHGIRHRLRLKVEDSVDDGKYALIVESRSVEKDESLFFKQFRISVRNKLTGQLIAETSFEDKLTDATEARSLTATPYEPYQGESPVNVFEFETLNVVKIPYVSINDDTRSIVIASAKSVDELANFIKIPRTFLLYEWNFPFVLD